jgi:capsular polysaccharide biosynthesis protein
MENNQTLEQELDLAQLIRILFVRWYIIVASVILVFGITTFYAFIMLDDVYTAQGSMLVQVESNETNTNDATNFQLGQRLVDTYTEIANSNRVINELKTNLDLPYTNSQIREMITVSGITNTIVIKLEVESKDPEEAQIMVNELLVIIESLAESEDFQSLQNIDVLDDANLPINPSGPNRLLYLAIGLVLGGIIGVGIIFAIEFLDKSIKSASDLENKLGLRTLGIIPDYHMEDEVEE